MPPTLTALAPAVLLTCIDSLDSNISFLFLKSYWSDGRATIFCLAEAQNLLKLDATGEQIDKLCAEAGRYIFKVKFWLPESIQSSQILRKHTSCYDSHHSRLRWSTTPLAENPGLLESYACLFQ